MGREEEAIKDYTKAVDINPQYEFAHVNRGKYYYKFLANVLKNLGRNEQAIKYDVKTIVINQKYA